MFPPSGLGIKSHSRHKSGCLLLNILEEKFLNSQDSQLEDGTKEIIPKLKQSPLPFLFNG